MISIKIVRPRDNPLGMATCLLCVDGKDVATFKWRPHEGVHKCLEAAATAYQAAQVFHDEITLSKTDITITNANLPCH